MGKTIARVNGWASVRLVSIKSTRIMLNVCSMGFCFAIAAFGTDSAVALEYPFRHGP